MEDFVTSNVFGFLKYADRTSHLGPGLQLVGIAATPIDKTDEILHTRSTTFSWT